LERRCLSLWGRRGDKHDKGGEPNDRLRGHGRGGVRANPRPPRGLGDGGRRAGHGVYPIIDDADPYGVGCSGPAVQAGSGLTAPRWAEVASWPSGTRPASRFHKRRQLFIHTYNETPFVAAVRVSNPVNASP